MHPFKKWLRLSLIDPWYVLNGYPNGGKPSPRSVASAHSYLESYGVLPIIKSGEQDEFLPNLADLAFLHRKIVERRPRCVLEFGCGFSTLVMAHALAHEARRPGGVQGELYSVDSSQEWIDNTLAKLPAEFSGFVHLSHCEVTASLH